MKMFKKLKFTEEVLLKLREKGNTFVKDPSFEEGVYKLLMIKKTISLDCKDCLDFNKECSRDHEEIVDLGNYFIRVEPIIKPKLKKLYGNNVICKIIRKEES